MASFQNTKCIILNNEIAIRFFTEHLILPQLFPSLLLFDLKLQVWLKIIQATFKPNVNFLRLFGFEIRARMCQANDILRCYLNEFEMIFQGRRR